MKVETRRYLVAYDIADDRRRSRLSKLLKQFGDRVQYSVFVVDAIPARRVELVARVEKTIKPAEDSVLICDLGRLTETISERFEFLGRAREVTTEDDFIL